MIMRKMIDEEVVSGTNFKHTSLIFNKYRPRDFILIVIAMIWGIVGFMLLLSIFTFSLVNLIIYASVPFAVWFLVQPLPHYHNYLEYFILNINFNKKTKVFSRILRKSNVSKKKLRKK